MGYCASYGQQDTVFLREANLSDSYLLRYTDSREKIILSDSVIERNGSLLTDLLNFNSLIYFKENGAGMVSSPAFRGTTASQTAVIWNGININSQFNGQTDFNTINAMAFDNIVVRPGGGSISYGSSAIGGSIHLNNELKFKNGFENQLLLRYGSFATYVGNFKSTYSDERISLQLNLGRTGSDNDYPFPDSDQKNLNGKYYNNSLSAAAAYKVNAKNLLKIYGNLYDGKRHFSLISPNAIPTAYADYNTRSLVEWNGFYGKFTSTLKAAFLNERYRYYAHIEQPDYETGKTGSWIANYDLGWRNHHFMINGLLTFSHIEATGTNIRFAKRQTAAAGLVLKQSLGRKFLYEAGLRQEISDAYRSPLLFSFGLKWNAASIYHLRMNFSKNFKMPTFNDLYWPGSGNSDLQPETSLQAEIGNQLKFQNLTFEVAGYFNAVENLIQWIPVSADFFKPENVGKVHSYGLESYINYAKTLGKSHLEMQASYAYTVSKDKRTDKQLIYVPFHKITASAAWSRERISAYYRIYYNGKVYTDPQHHSTLKDFTVSDLGLEYALGKNKVYILGFQIRNLWNEAYQNVLNRPMPGRNYNVYINFKF